MRARGLQESAWLASPGRPGALTGRIFGQALSEQRWHGGPSRERRAAAHRSVPAPPLPHFAFRFHPPAAQEPRSGRTWCPAVALHHEPRLILWHHLNAPPLSLCANPTPDPAATVRRAALASQILADMGLNTVERSALGRVALKRARECLDNWAIETGLPIQLRSEAASARGWLGAWPPGVGCRPDGLPDLVFEPQVFPADMVRLRESGAVCQLAHPYRIARYPVTVAQYEPFKAVGYDEKNPDAARWWGEKGWRWKERERITGPRDFAPVFQTPNHPRVGVSWFEAMAFCAWASEQLRLTIRLPHEAEWEQAARWDGTKADGRTYPWGESDRDDLAQRCNWDGTGLNQTSAVGLFPPGRAVCGAMDLAGNVWEWCESPSQLFQSWRVLRGGSWFNVSPSNLSCSYRGLSPPGFRSQSFGFRCVLVDGGSACS